MCVIQPIPFVEGHRHTSKSTVTIETKRPGAVIFVTRLRPFHKCVAAIEYGLRQVYCFKCILTIESRLKVHAVVGLLRQEETVFSATICHGGPSALNRHRNWHGWDRDGINEE